MKHKIRIKKFVDKPELSWEERFNLLMDHHEEETEYLIAVIEDLEEKLEK